MVKVSAPAAAALEKAAALQKAAWAAAQYAELDSAVVPGGDGVGGEEQGEALKERKAQKKEEQMRPYVSASRFKLEGGCILVKLAYIIYYIFFLFYAC